MENKVCYVCGREIKFDDSYWCTGPNSYVCFNRECLDFATWDLRAARCAVNTHRHYVVSNHKFYTLEPLQKEHVSATVTFNDGKIFKTDNLVYIDDIPQRWWDKIPDNATFKYEKE